MKRSVLTYLADRLQRIDDPECLAAFQVATTALENFDAVEASSTASEHVFHTMWGHITRALDHGEYPRQFERELDAIEAELAGHVLVSRLIRGGFPSLSQQADEWAKTHKADIPTRLLAFRVWFKNLLN